MNTKDLLKSARSIWGDQEMSLEHIVIAMGTVYGDIARYSRDKIEGNTQSDEELKKELGNIIFSTIRWCNDLGYSPEECLRLAIDSQKAYVEKKQI